VNARPRNGGRTLYPILPTAGGPALRTETNPAVSPVPTSTIAIVAESPTSHARAASATRRCAASVVVGP
jgi:hypothetical protein